MSDPRNWDVRSTDGSGNPDYVVNSDTGREGRVYSGMSGSVSDVRDEDGNSIGSIESSSD